MKNRKKRFRSRPRIDGVMLRNREGGSLRRKRRRSFPMLSEVDIVYRRSKHIRTVRITTSKDAYELLIQLFDPRKIDYKEMFCVILLNAANICLGYSQIGVGATSGVAVNVREIFHLTLKTNASAVIIAHNHPSGSLKVSEADILLTKKIIQGCCLFDVRLLDHIVLSSDGYCSLADEGLL